MPLAAAPKVIAVIVASSLKASMTVAVADNVMLAIDADVVESPRLWRRGAHPAGSPGRRSSRRYSSGLAARIRLPRMGSTSAGFLLRLGRSDPPRRLVAHKGERLRGRRRSRAAPAARPRSIRAPRAVTDAFP